MDGNTPQAFTGVVLRKQDDLPRFVVLGFDPAETWGVNATCLVTGSFGGVPFERRSIVPWGDNRRWFMSLSEPLCAAADVGTGQDVYIEVALPPQEAPCDLAEALEAGRVTKAWSALSAGKRRDLILHICEAKKPETRAKRVAEALALLGVGYEEG